MEYPKTANKTVCIVATGYLWDNCVFGNPKHDYWTLNNMYESGAKPELFDEWFQLHRAGSNVGHIDDIKSRQFVQEWERPLWVQRDWGEEMPVKNPWIYPIDEVIERFCPRSALGEPYPYFTNTIDYMVCLAALRGYTEIQLHGVEFISEEDNEYYKMRQSVNFYLGRAMEMGIRIMIQVNSSMLKGPYWYGWEEAKQDTLEKIMNTNLDKFKQEREVAEREKIVADRKICTLDGGKQAIEQLLKIHSLKDKGAQL